MKRRVQAALAEAAPEGLVALVNSGGSVLGMGTCLDAYRLPSGMRQRNVALSVGRRPASSTISPGAAVPVIHMLNIKRLALDWGLPFDPVPLPAIGENPRIYGRLSLPLDRSMTDEDMIDVGWVFAAMVAAFAVTSLRCGGRCRSTLILDRHGRGAPGRVRHSVPSPGRGRLRLSQSHSGAVRRRVLRTGDAATAAPPMRWPISSPPAKRAFCRSLSRASCCSSPACLPALPASRCSTVGAFAAPLLQRAGLTPPIAAAYIALMGTLGMIAPPLNVPAMVMADGVNMPYAGFAPSLWTLSLPTALFVFATFTRRAGAAPASPASEPQREDAAPFQVRARWLVRAAILAVIVFWAIVRYWPDLVFDPSIPLVLVVASLVGDVHAVRARLDAGGALGVLRHPALSCGSPGGRGRARSDHDADRSARMAGHPGHVVSKPLGVTGHWSAFRCSAAYSPPSAPRIRSAFRSPSPSSTRI